MSRLFLPLSALLLATGCGPTEDASAARDCEPEAVDLSACDRASLGALQAQGIWNLHLTFAEGDTAASAIRFSGGGGAPLLVGLPMTEQRVEGDSLFLFSDVVGQGGVPWRYLFSGCSASGPGRLQGQFRRCIDGQKDLEGHFEATRLTPREGEAEAAGVELVSEVALPTGEAADVFVADGHAYVAALEGGLFVYDVRTPGQPLKVAELLPSNDSWSQVWVHQQTAYIASAQRGILVYDVSDPAAPRRVAALPERATQVSALFVEGSTLYAASPQPNADVLLYDVTQPAAPVLLSRHYVEDSNPRAGELPMELFAHGGRLYVGHWAYGLAVLDVSNPKAPTRVGRYQYPGATSRAVVVGPVGQSTLAFEAGEGWGAHLRVLNVDAPEGIVQVGEYRGRPEVSIRSLALAGTRLYVAHYQDGLRILDVSQPGAPREVGHYNTWRETDPGRGRSFFEGLSAVRVPGDGRVYAAETSRGLLIFRETN